MIQIVKLQHFASNGKSISFDSTEPINVDMNFYTKSSSSKDKERQPVTQSQPPAKPQKPDFEKLKQALNVQEENKHRKVSPISAAAAANRDQFIITNSIPDEKSSKTKNASVSRSKSAVDMPTSKYAAHKISSNVGESGENASDIVAHLQNTSQKSILKKQSFKDKKILEWAKKKSLTVKELSKLTESAELESLLITPKENKTSAKLSSPSKANSKPMKEEDEDDLNLGEAAAAVIQKSDIERNLRMKLFESQLIDLSKARFKTLEMVDHQKKLFIDQQLKKARSLPGLLRCTALQFSQIQTNPPSMNTPTHDQSSAKSFKTDNNFAQDSDDDYVKLNSPHPRQLQRYMSQLQKTKERLAYDNVLQGQGIKKSNSIHTSHNIFYNKIGQSVHENIERIQSPANLVSSHNLAYQSTGAYPSYPSYPILNPKLSSSRSFHPGTEIKTSNPNFESQNDALTIRGLRTTHSKSPHVSFFLHGYKASHSGNSDAGEAELKYKDEAGSAYSNSNYALAPSMHSSSGHSKKVVSLHLQFSNGMSSRASNHESLDGAMSLHHSKSIKSSVHREVANTLSRKSAQVTYQKSINRIKDERAQAQSPMNSGRLKLHSASHSNTNNFLKYVLDGSASSDNVGPTSPVNSLSSFNAKNPTTDNRFQDLLRIVKPPYKIEDSKDVNKIIDKNEALKPSYVDVDSRERMSRMKEKGNRLAAKAKMLLESGEYD